MAYFAPEDERLDRQGLAQLQRHKLADVLNEIHETSGFYARKLADLNIDPAADPMHLIPLTTRDELQRDQIDHPPFGSFHTQSIEAYTRFHQTSGSVGAPLRCLDTPEGWDWFLDCWRIVLCGSGVRPDDRIIYPFSFGPFIGFWAAFEAATGLGNLCLPAGGMSTPARLRYMIDNEITVVCCTPTYAMRLADVAADEGIDLRSTPVRLLIVAGEPGGSIPSIRSRIEAAWDARVVDHAGMTEIGPWGFECEEAPGGMHVIESEFITEVIDPATGDPIDDGQEGELVLTNLGRHGLPMIRYRTGDQVVLTRDLCACGRWFARSEGGVRGRIDDMLVIRGNNVFPSAIEAILREFEGVAEFRILVGDGSALKQLHLEVEPATGTDADTLAGAIENTIRDRLHFRPVVSMAAPGSLPRYEMKARRVVRKENSSQNA